MARLMAGRAGPLLLAASNTTQLNRGGATATKGREAPTCDGYGLASVDGAHWGM